MPPGSWPDRGAEGPPPDMRRTPRGKMPIPGMGRRRQDKGRGSALSHDGPMPGMRGKAQKSDRAAHLCLPMPDGRVLQESTSIPGARQYRQSVRRCSNDDPGEPVEKAQDSGGGAGPGHMPGLRKGSGPPA